VSSTAVILSTGDELTTGKVIDTNSAVIADRLHALGLSAAAVLKVGDDRRQLLWALAQARMMGDVIIGTGGLGPTADDLTTETVAEFLAVPLVLDDAVAGALKERFEARGIGWTENNLKQARFPESATIIANPLGTAPGFRVALAPGKTLVWLSGVPQEMIAMLDATVLPWMRAELGLEGRIYSRSFKIYGLTESKLDSLVAPLALSEKEKLSFRAHYPDLTLRLSAGEGPPEAFARRCDEIRSILGSHIYAEGDVTMEQAVAGLLADKRATLAVAESCTGGLISRRIARIAGISAHYLGGVVSYANEAKIELLGVRRETLENFGAVSEETAREMAQGIRERLGATLALSVTGIAGPSGGSAAKPVGTVWMGLARVAGAEARLFRFHGERERIILGAAQAGLNWLRTALAAGWQ
jgi:nicotinamide-nucleotide amidase